MSENSDLLLGLILIVLTADLLGRTRAYRAIRHDWPRQLRRLFYRLTGR